MTPERLAVYLINLDRSPQRLATMRERLARLGWVFERVPAVDGKTLDLASLAEIDRPAFERAQGRRLLAGDVGCYLSHLACLRRFLASDHDWAVVLEDDAVPEADFAAVVEALLRTPAAWDVVKLSGYHAGSPVTVQPLGAQHTLGIPFSRHCNTAALLFNRAGAGQVLAALLPMMLPYDHALERPWLHGARLRIVTPAPCRAGDGSDTTIVLQPDHKIRGWRRWPTYVFRLRTELARLGWALGQVWRRRGD